MASNILSLDKKKIIDVNLKKLSDLLEIDRIYYYNLNGKVIDSTIKEDIGWVAKKGHPVYKFIKSRKIFSVENNIRKDTCDKKYFKYGYYYIPNQGYIQIGIHADKVQDFLDSFEVERILNEMFSLDKVKNVAFIKDSKTNYFSRSSNEKLEIDTDLVDQILNEKKSLVTKYSKNKSKYSVYLPIKLEKSIEGGLLTEFNLIDTKKSIKKLKLITAFILFIVYIIFIYVLFLKIKNKNKILTLAYCDNLTNLPNVNYFIDNYSETINNVKAVFVIKFVSLETINMTYGYNYGSEILKQIANKLILYAQEKNVEIFKTKEDEFIISWESHKTKQELIKSVKKLIKFFQKKWKLKMQ
ncbi:MAG: diguanylate cyclase domain-containing protein [Bacillota bacterium]